MDGFWNPNTHEWNVSWPQRISQHDVVYLSPPDDPMQGLPVGNGDFGALVWTQDRFVHIAVNKVDTWDDGPAGSIESWDPAREETNTALRGCGKIVLDFGLPLWDPLYLSDFQGRVGLADAVAGLRAQSPFGRASLRAFVSAAHKVLVIEIETETTEPVAHQVLLERFGSRVFAHWYSQVNRDPALGLDGTATEIQNDRIIIRQQLRTIHFVVGLALMAQTPILPQRNHNRAGQFSVPAGNKHRYTLFLSVVTSENAADPAGEVHARLDAAIHAGNAAMYARHADDWKQFWRRAFVHLPDPYIAAAWHNTLYLAASSARGSSPPHFCNALWNPQRDFVPWAFFLEWNMHWLGWMAHPAGSGELIEPYLNYRFQQLPIAVRDAKSEFGADGAFYSDISDGRGNQQTGAHVRASGMMIALDFWRHYEFTLDRAFLKNRAYPVIRDVVRFMLTQITSGEDGKFHPAPDTAYEGTPILSDVITSLALIRALFPVVILAADLLGADDLPREQIRDVLARLADYRFEELSDDEVEIVDGRKAHAAGLGKGTPLLSDRVPLAGFDPKVTRWRRTRIGGQVGDYAGVPDAELCPAFPAGVIGLNDCDTDLFKALVTFARLHPTLDNRPVPKQQDSMEGGDGLCMGWCPIAIACARLGLKTETVAMIRDHLRTWQIYPQGFGHYGPWSVYQKDKTDFHRVNQVRDAKHPDQNFPLPTWPFRHFDTEPLYIVAVAVNEMLLQSHEGLIRLCPAVPDDWDVAFTLGARGGFAVSAQKSPGRLDWVAVESRLGGELVLENPWPGESVYLWSKPQTGPWKKSTETLSGNTIRRPTQPGEHSLFCTDPNALDRWTLTELPAHRNDVPRTLDPAILGKPRMF